jgi:thioredoxin reductase
VVHRLVKDVIIIGAGPAGLSAALWLGRCGRATLVFDDDRPRNGASRGLRGYLTRDGVSPAELRRLGRADVSKYPSVQMAASGVRDAARIRGGFEVQTADGHAAAARALLLATGRRDTLPELPDAARFYGRGLYHCPYCDGWEHRGQPLGVLGHTPEAADTAELLSIWSRNITLCTNGEKLAGGVPAGRFPVAGEKIVRLIGDDHLVRLELEQGRTIGCRALFFCSDCEQRSVLPERLGCRFDAEGSVQCEAHAATNVPGLFVAGNVRGGIHLAIMAAAEGAEAAVAINRYLLERGHGPELPAT